MPPRSGWGRHQGRTGDTEVGVGSVGVHDIAIGQLLSDVNDSFRHGVMLHGGGAADRIDFVRVGRPGYGVDERSAMGHWLSRSRTSAIEYASTLKAGLNDLEG